MLGAKTSPEKPISNLFPKISAFTEEGNEGQQIGNNLCNPIFIVTHGKIGYETHAAQKLGIREQSYSKHVVAKFVSNFLCFTVSFLSKTYGGTPSVQPRQERSVQVAADKPPLNR